MINFNNRHRFTPFTHPESGFFGASGNSTSGDVTGVRKWE